MTPLRVEVVYALPRRCEAVQLEVRPGTTVRAAIEASGLLARFPQIDLGRQQVGIHGRRTGLDAVLADGDRVEIYRPLLADPKTLRRERVRANRAR